MIASTLRKDFRQTTLFLGLTAILAGYFLVWLPGPGAGLRLIGIEVGEWIKFLGVGSSRNLFYLPPIVLGLLLALLTIQWPNSRWQTWLARLLAVAVSLLAFPAVAAITSEPSSEWLMRLSWIGLLFVVALMSSVAGQFPGARHWAWALMGLIALLGAILPTWQYLTVRPIVADILQRPIGIGLGVWLNALGCALVALISIWNFRGGFQGLPKTNSHTDRAAV